MKRREFLLLGGWMLIWPLAAHAQQPARHPTVGVLVIAIPGSEKFWRIFRESMRDLGYVEGQTVRYEFRSGQASQLPELAAELVRLKVDLIVGWFTPGATAAKQATRDIPVVMAGAGDPIGTGLVESLGRPGGNVTGMGGLAPELAGKCVELIREMLPASRRVAALVNTPDPFSKPFLEKIRAAGDATATAIESISVRGPEALDAGFLELERARPDAVIVQPSLGAKYPAELRAQVPAAGNFDFPTVRRGRRADELLGR